MPKFSEESANRLALAHPLLQKLMNAAILEFDFCILSSQRGRADQERAFTLGHTRVHFGDSAHNWKPSVALDVAPNPLDWKNLKPFHALSKVILRLAMEMNIPIRWGGDWDGDGDLTDQTFIDLPHYELHKWRDYAKHCQPFGS